ncbi:Fe-S cluster assembly protein HesB [Lysobacteraceae bacterium NML03-0222]|nr:Fe-S cluster assembly protein HesB [Xanthomonadaceae bacterium NML03-0222]
MAVTLAPAALARVQSYLAADPAKQGLRFGVKRTGCSGWGYAIDMADAAHDNDHVFEQGGVRVLVDADSLPLVDGTEIDFLKQGLNEQFVFRNPNVKGECGCGESFTTEPDKDLD